MDYICNPARTFKDLKLFVGFPPSQRSWGGGFKSKPLALFVVLSALLSVWQFYSCYYALGFRNDPCSNPREDVTIGFANFIYIQIAFAFLNLYFLNEFQKRVVRRIVRLAGWPGIPAEAIPGPVLEKMHTKWQWREGKSECIRTQWKTIEITKEIVRQGVREAFLYDLRVLFYFIASFGIMVLSFMSPSEMTHMSTCPEIDMVRWNGMSFFLLAATYTALVSCFWFFCFGSDAVCQVLVDVRPLGPGMGNQATTLGAPSNRT